MKPILIFGISILINLLLLPGCHNNSRNEESGGKDIASVSEDAGAGNNQVVLTRAQVQTAHIILGALSQKNMSKEITANGTLALQPDHFATVSTPANGYITRIYFREGDKIKKGAVLAILRHPDYVSLQQDFLEAAARFEYLQKELARQKTLSEANVSAQKQYEQTQADYETARARYLTETEQLKFLGLRPDSVENGKIRTSIYLKAPISGNISQINIHKGELLSPQQTAFEIVDNSHLMARLSVFEKDVNQIHPGEGFIFTVPAFGDSLYYQGKITGSGRILDQDSRTMEVVGAVEENPALLAGLYIEAQIKTGEKEVYALPEEAVAREQDGEYIFVNVERQAENSGGSNMVYKKIKVSTGSKEDGFVQIIAPDSLMIQKNIVLSGAFYLNAEMNKGEGDED